MITIAIEVREIETSEDVSTSMQGGLETTV